MTVFSILTTIPKNADFGKLDQFFRSVSLINTDYIVVVANNSRLNVEKILDKYNIKEYEILSNAVEVNKVTCVNQCLLKSFGLSEYSVYINSDKSLVVNCDFLKSLEKYKKENFGIGGDFNTVRISKNEKIIKIIKSSTDGDINWLYGKLDKKMSINCVNSNIFVVNNKNMKDLGFPDSDLCEFENYGIDLSFRFLSKNFSVEKVKEIFSSEKDCIRFDIGDKIKSGAMVVCPVVSSSVRERLLN